MIADVPATATTRADASIDRACFGVAGPVIGDTGAADQRAVAASTRARSPTTFGIRRVRLLNDLQAMAYAVPVLRESELHVLQEGEALRGGNIALIAAGTGLGEALLHNVDGRFVPSPSEGGHADFAARTEREIALLRDLTARYGRADVEHVVSGRGLVNIHRVDASPTRARPASISTIPDAPAAISAAALERRCAGCVETLDMFVEAYGAEAGNLALRTRVDRRRVHRRRHRAEDPAGAHAPARFMRAFRAKPPLDAMLAAMPVKVILNAEAGLLGAAVFAAGDVKRYFCSPY